jgi:hypothetical protein
MQYAHPPLVFLGRPEAEQPVYLDFFVLVTCIVYFFLFGLKYKEKWDGNFFKIFLVSGCWRFHVPCAVAGGGVTGFLASPLMGTGIYCH